MMEATCPNCHAVKTVDTDLADSLMAIFDLHRCGLVTFCDKCGTMITVNPYDRSDDDDKD